jgi:hypothetical protein
MGCRALREGGHGLRWGGGKRKGRTWWGGKAREEGRGQSGSRESVSRILHPQAEARARWDMGLRGTGQRERESGERREERRACTRAACAAALKTNNRKEPKATSGTRALSARSASTSEFFLYQERR